MTRVISLGAASGSQEILVNDLPEQIVPESLFAEGVDGVEVRAVRFRAQALSEEPRNEVRAIDESIEQTQQKLAENTKSQELLDKQTKYLDQLEGFVAPTSQSDLARGVLDAEALEKVTQFRLRPAAAIEGQIRRSGARPPESAKGDSKYSNADVLN